MLLILLEVKCRGRKCSVYKFSEVDSTAQEANQPLMYVVNYKQGGYALVSADKRVQAPILALIDKGCFNINVAKNDSLFLFLQEKLQTM